MKIRFLLLFIFLLTSGCSVINSYSDTLTQDINQWIKERKYNVALNTIDYINPKHKDYSAIQKQKKVILKKMASYERSAIKKSTKLSKQGNWIKAFELLDEVTENIINTKNIKQHRAKLLTKRDKVIINYENDILYRQAKYLSGNIKLYKKINNLVSEDEENLLGISSYDELRSETGLRIFKRSKRQYKTKKYKKALASINLALKLTPGKDVSLLRSKIKKHIKTKTKTKKKTKTKTKRKKPSKKKNVNALLKKLSKGYNHALLKETKATIAWLNTVKGKNKVYNEQIKKLKYHLAAGIKQDFEAGRKLYSNDKIQQALSIWLVIHKIDPEYPNLQSHIKRAKKVLSKLKKLSAKSN